MVAGRLAGLGAARLHAAWANHLPFLRLGFSICKMGGF